LGGGSARRSPRDPRLLERAVRERWAIPAKLRRSLVPRLGAILEQPGVGDREAIAAVKAILTASKINLQNVGVAMKAQEFVDLIPRLEAVERRIAERNGKR
jgi:hypothetical protein